MAGDSWTGKTVLVTGALGFIGSHFVERLAAAGATVLGLHRSSKPELEQELGALPGVSLFGVDLLDHAELRFAFRHFATGIDAVVHCAALDGNASFKRTHSAEILDTNLRTTSNLLGCVRDFDVTRLVVLSSSEALAGHGPAPVSEEHAARRSLQASDNGYVLSKIFGEVLAEQFQQQYGTRVHLVRPTNVFGPRDSFGGTRSRVIPAMISRLEAGEEIEIWGDGSQTRSFVYVTDLVRASLELVESGRYPALNVATTGEISMLELARQIAAVTGGHERVRVDPARPGGAASQVMDTSRLHDLISFRPLSLREGLVETVRWFRDSTAADRSPRGKAISVSQG